MSVLPKKCSDIFQILQLKDFAILKSRRSLQYHNKVKIHIVHCILFKFYRKYRKEA